MPKVLVTESHLENIADAIRAKNGGSSTYRPGDMAQAIAAIPTGITPSGSINITQNGTVDVTNYASAVVNVSGGGGGIKSGTAVPTTSDISAYEMYVQIANVCTRDADVTSKPSGIIDPDSATAGQNASNAAAAFTRTDTSANWSTQDNNYNDLWIVGIYNTAQVCNFLAVRPRTWNNNRQINNIYVEASNDGSSWVELGRFEGGNSITQDYWAVCPFDNSNAYNQYRLRTDQNSGGTINGSVTFTIYGIGFGYDSSLSPSGYDQPIAVYQNIDNNIVKQL